MRPDARGEELGKTIASGAAPDLLAVVVTLIALSEQGESRDALGMKTVRQARQIWRVMYTRFLIRRGIILPLCVGDHARKPILSHV
jgi:hypothetical protein